MQQPIRNHSTRSIQKIPGKYPPTRPLNQSKSTQIPMFFPASGPSGGSRNLPCSWRPWRQPQRLKERRGTSEGVIGAAFLRASLVLTVLTVHQSEILPRLLMIEWTIVFWFCMSYHEIQRVPVICPFNRFRELLALWLWYHSCVSYWFLIGLILGFIIGLNYCHS